jgi:hypothetical protein
LGVLLSSFLILVLGCACDRRARSPVRGARDGGVVRPIPAPNPRRGWYHWIDPKGKYSVGFPREPVLEEDISGPPSPLQKGQRLLELDEPGLRMSVLSEMELMFPRQGEPDRSIAALANSNRPGTDILTSGLGNLDPDRCDAVAVFGAADLRF